MDDHSRRNTLQSKKRKKAGPAGKRLVLIAFAATLIAALIAGGIACAVTVRNSRPDTPVPGNDPPRTTAKPPETEPPPTESQLQPMNKTMYVTASALNVREAPGAESKILMTLEKGAEVSVVGKYSGGWYRVRVRDVEGCCASKYLSDKQETPLQTEFPYLLAVNRKQNLVIAYAKDDRGEYTVPHRAMLCSVGFEETPTPLGTFRTTDKYVWRALVDDLHGQYATRFKGHYLFHSVPYTAESKDRLEEGEYNRLGRPASKGCVRLTVADAKWIYDNCPSGTTVRVYDSDGAEPLPKPSAQKLDPSDPKRGWDPTDPDGKNPWRQATPAA